MSPYIILNHKAVPKTERFSEHITLHAQKKIGKWMYDSWFDGR
jgi:hypothetical protein